MPFQKQGRNFESCGSWRRAFAMLSISMNEKVEGDLTIAPSDGGPSQGEDTRWLADWLMHGHGDTAAKPTAPWWQVMCLTGVDYFSTLGYQPGFALLAAGALAPLATLVLVLVTLFVALPVYRQVAQYSPHGQGSVLMLEQLLPRWRGKALVLVLLGFAFTAFIVTMTISASDATKHIAENPYVPKFIEHHPVLMTGLLLVALGAVFLKGFHEAIGVAVFIVLSFLLVNVVVLGRGVLEVMSRDHALATWWQAALEGRGGFGPAILASVILFPSLALGLSGFETGVGVMPLVRGDAADDPQWPAGRIRNARKLLLWAALIMSAALVVSSVVTTILVPEELYRQGGEANGRVLAYLAHHYLGDKFGTLYDVLTIAILWFAGASAMAGLLNLVPQYLPPYGMAPDWARATRPLVLVFTLISLVVTWLFDANIDRQQAAYATGVLALMGSAALAVAIQKWREQDSRFLYAAMALVFAYTILVTVWSSPEGIKIALLFVAGIVGLSIVSRTMRATELRTRTVDFSPLALNFLGEFEREPVRIIAHRPDKRTVVEYETKERQAREDHSLNDGEKVIFLEVTQGDASSFMDDVHVRAVRIGTHKILRCSAAAIPNAIAAILLESQKVSGQIAHAYFGWTEGNPMTYVLKYIVLGEGDTAPVTREVLRRAVSDPKQRPRIHVG